MMEFSKAFEIVVGIEGDLSLDPEDRGNWTGGEPGKGELKGTRFGISAASYPLLDIAGLSIEAARLIYRRDYWDPLSIDALPHDLQLPVFDMAVNQGRMAAVKTLQRAARVKDDGTIGRLTIRAIWAAEVETWIRFMAKRARRYAGSDQLARYGDGWFDRLMRVAYKSLRTR